LHVQALQFSLSKETNSVGIEKVKEPASSPNIEGQMITLQEQQIAGGMALHASDTAHLQSDNIIFLEK